MNTLKLLLAFFVVTNIFTQAVSQLQQPHRFEKEQRYSDEDFSIIPLKIEGIALVREVNRYKSGNHTWEVTLLDSALQENATLELEIDTRNHLAGYEVSPGAVHLLFVRKDTKGEMDIVSINLKSRESILYKIRPELNFQITHFICAGENFVFGGYVNMESAVLLYMPSINNTKILPGFFQKSTDLVDLRTNYNQTFNVLLVDRVDRDNRKIIFRTFESTGKQLFECSANIDDDMFLHSGISSALEKEDLLVIGTWGKRNSKQASGIYTLSINPFAEQKINRVYFGQLEHYLDYLKPKKIASIKLRTQRSLELGKIPDFTNYVMPFKIVEHTNGFLLLAGSYIPSTTGNPTSRYSTAETNYPSYTPYGSLYPTTRTPAPGYTYGNNVANNQEVKNVHGAVVAFDNAGGVLWDYSIKLEKIKKQSLEQVVDFYTNDDGLLLLYKKESEIRQKEVEFSSGQATEFTDEIRLKDSYDEIRNEDNPTGLIQHWYGSNFYVWGYQTIRNKHNAAKTRQVFYINKVVAP